jgi:hypothetical protein
VSFVDPAPPAEGMAMMKAADLVNKVCLFRPVEVGEWPAKPAADGKKAQAAQKYIECDVWVLDRAGVLEEGTGVRVAWYRCVDDLEAKMGQFVGGKPVKEDGTNSIILVPLEGAARDVAAQVVTDLAAAPVADESDGTEPF